MIFIDSSAWFAAVNRRDRHHPRATIHHSQPFPRPDFLDCRSNQIRSDGTARITKVVSFDDDFVIYRYGQNLVQAFEVLR